VHVSQLFGVTQQLLSKRIKQEMSKVNNLSVQRFCHAFRIYTQKMYRVVQKSEKSKTPDFTNASSTVYWLIFFQNALICTVSRKNCNDNLHWI